MNLRDESVLLLGKVGYITVTVTPDFEPNMLITDNGQTAHARALDDLAKSIDEAVQRTAAKRQN